MIKYNIKLSPKAYNDLKRINEYISNELLEPEIAHNLFNLLINAIRELDNFPNRNPKVILTKNFHAGLRKLKVKNYLILYDVEEEIKIIYIHRILHSTSNWGSKI